MLAVSGAMIQIHFCDSKLESWTINKEGKDCCCEGESDHNQNESFTNDKDDCCTDQTFVVKTVSDQINISAFQFLFSDFKATVPGKLNVPAFISPLEYASRNTYQSNAPPGLWQDIPLFKLHQRFTYYS